jgi:glucose/arabinose dehydrogenase
MARCIASTPPDGAPVARGQQFIRGVVAVTLVLAACGEEPTTATTATTPTTATTATTPTTATAPAFDAADVTMVQIAGGIDRPVEIAWYRDPEVAYLATQGGLVLPLRGAEVGTPVLDLSADLATETVEQGLLGLVFHPADPFAYVNYTRGDGDTVIAEYEMLGDGTFAVDTARTVLVIDQPTPSHNGGNLTFGPDGYLYIGVGDGGMDNDPDRRALDPAELLGKILRIDPRPDGDAAYGIPADNPFVTDPGARPEIWSIGVRNPWRFAFDPATGHLWVGDVGQNLWEEVSVAFAAADGTAAGRGANFGWSAWEGSHPFNDDQQAPDALMPVFEYEHGDQGCAVAGGTVYRGAAIPTMVGWYVFGDWCSGRVWAIPGDVQPGSTIDASQLQLIGQPGTIASVRTAPSGESWVVGFTTGAVHRIDPAA